MTPEQHAAIAALSDDAPATAVIAAWAGYEVTCSTSKSGRVACSYLNKGEWLGIAAIENMRERTLRGWLLDGGLQFNEWKIGKYKVTIYNMSHFHTGVATTPAAAFAAACGQFAAALREEAGA